MSGQTRELMRQLFHHLFDLRTLHGGSKVYSLEDGHEVTVEEVCMSIINVVTAYLTNSQGE